MRKDYQGLMRVLDSHDTFVTGHQIIKTAGATLHNQRVQNIPDWTKNDEEVRKLLKTAFPKLNEESRVGRKQRIYAARWLRIIHLYCRMGWTGRKVAEEMGISLETFKNLRSRIFRVQKGLTSSGTVRVQSGAGRPRKIVTP
jgi:hypothetical protein